MPHYDIHEIRMHEILDRLYADGMSPGDPIYIQLDTAQDRAWNPHRWLYGPAVIEYRLADGDVIAKILPSRK